MSNHFVDDGCTERVYIKGVPGLYDDVRLFHRPMTIDERDSLLDRVDARRRAGQAVTRVVCEEMAVRFRDCSLGDMTAERYARLKPALWERLYLLLLGRDGGDPDPAADPDETDKARTETLEERQEAREKN